MHTLACIPMHVAASPMKYLGNGVFPFGNRIVKLLESLNLARVCKLRYAHRDIRFAKYRLLSFPPITHATQIFFNLQFCKVSNQMKHSETHLPLLLSEQATAK